MIIIRLFLKLRFQKLLQQTNSLPPLIHLSLSTPSFLLRGHYLLTTCKPWTLSNCPFWDTTTQPSSINTSLQRRSVHAGLQHLHPLVELDARRWIVRPSPILPFLTNTWDLPTLPALHNTGTARPTLHDAAAARRAMLMSKALLQSALVSEVLLASALTP